MKRILLVLAVVLIMAAVAAPSALAHRTHTYCYENSSGGVVETICGDASGPFLSKKECEQARANDPAANDTGRCFKRS
jgi:hypothetical protein